MTCQMIRRENGVWRVLRPLDQNVFRRARGRFPRPRKVGFTRELPTVDLDFVRRIEIREVEPVADKVVRVKICDARSYSPTR
jgi:hypothetical protein